MTLSYTLALIAFASQLAHAVVYNATFTWYGLGDEHGSPNCNTAAASCGFSTFPGFSASLSENLFDSRSYCGKCLKLNAKTDMSGNQKTGFGVDIIIMVNNVCKAAGNPLCAQRNLTTPNQFKGNINVNLCSDNGARVAVFGRSGVGLAVGTAEEVECDQWSGTRMLNGRTNRSGQTSPAGVIDVRPGNGQGVISAARPAAHLSPLAMLLAIVVVLALERGLT